MLVSKAFASSGTGVPDGAGGALPPAAPDVPVPGAPDAASLPPAAGGTEMLLWNIGLIGVLVAMFYLLLIRPQQKRFKEHKDMLGALKKGDKVLTGGGLIGRVDKIVSDTEILIDLGNGLKVTALRSTVQGRMDDTTKAA